MDREKVLVVCPGRGSYTKETLGYLKPFESDPLIKFMDEKRKTLGEPGLWDLDGAPAFQNLVHAKGEHASLLIYSCSYADFISLDRNRYELVAIIGNSMGWYTSLSLAKALNREGTFSVIQTMGGMMRQGVIGGQVICSIMDENWIVDEVKRQSVFHIIEQVNNKPGGQAYISIHLGGYLVIGANEEGLSILLRELPREEPYPLQLLHHGAFHTPLLSEVSKRAFSLLPVDLFNPPEIPIIDGRGRIWTPYSTDPEELRQYTLGWQVVKPYDFTKSVEVALKEFAPEKIILLGPGNTLGGVLGQIMVEVNWKNLDSKQKFTDMQSRDPYLISMGLLKTPVSLR